MRQKEADFFSELTISAENNITQLGITAKLSPQASTREGNLDDYTSFIQVSGAIQGGVIFTVEAELALLLAQSYLLDPVTPDEAKTYAVEVVAELSNVICGNAITERGPHPIYLGNPLIFVAQQAEIRTRSAQPLAQYYDTDNGSFQIMFIPMDQESELATILNVQ
ncbi:chemotaxis protein CheX [Cohnella silvisoli]|uniref:Chemotaxis protein CheX n=1 Tax=Cohnella silvisoli TaxID=2873699 RepID=A0ABV1KQL4_9BACL|nr:chemotaxis protein CheX [Cohnella silvisoli]MCD9022173.1 chemotaxis protein CheX [Cohnella silvisoli]